jgi:protein-S-isoprenylcysteine O-methyltransferase Ste14
VSSVTRLFFRNLAFVVLVPGTLAVFIPLALLAPGALRLAGMRWTGLALSGIGAFIALRCIGAFWITGGGTPAPVDPPKVLVSHGPYRYVRNPMYIGVLLIIAGEAVLCMSAAIGIYLLCVAICFQVFVILYEEPVLRRLFGKEYEAYLLTTPRWIPRIRIRGRRDHEN